MESKVLIDIDIHRQEHIKLHVVPSDDVRDKLLVMFVETTMPCGGEKKLLNGYCRIRTVRRIDKDEKVSLLLEIVPVHPIDMLKCIPLVKENAALFGANEDEKQLVETMNDMCEHSLDPETFSAWEHVKNALTKNRSALKQ